MFILNVSYFLGALNVVAWVGGRGDGEKEYVSFIITVVISIF